MCAVAGGGALTQRLSPVSVSDAYMIVTRDPVSAYLVSARRCGSRLVVRRCCRTNLAERLGGAGRVCARPQRSGERTRHTESQTESLNLRVTIKPEHRRTAPTEHENRRIDYRDAPLSQQMRLERTGRTARHGRPERGEEIGVQYGEERGEVRREPRRDVELSNVERGARACAHTQLYTNE